MTLKEIAQAAGVSVSTVSRVVNSKNTKAASAEVRNKIWKIVRESGYTPNESARNLQRGTPKNEKSKKGKIYVIFARKIDTYIDPFFTDLMHSIEQEAFSRKHPVQTIMSDLELSSLNSGNLERNAGAIILGQINLQNLAVLKGQFKNLVYIGLNALPEDADIDQVLCSGYKAARSAIAYLTGQGHRKILYVGETHNEERYEGYLDELKNAGITSGFDLIYQAQLSPLGGYNCMVKILDKKPRFTAIFCANDDTAIGVVRALVEHGIRVPEDVSVVGMDDIEMSRYMSPMLTTVHIPTEEMGKQAAKVLIDRMEGGHKTPIKVKFPSSLSPRESCRALTGQ